MLATQEIFKSWSDKAQEDSLSQMFTACHVRSITHILSFSCPAILNTNNPIGYLP